MSDLSERCDRCDGPIPNTRVTITLAVDEGELEPGSVAEIRATLCTIGCAMEWLGMTRDEVLSFRQRKGSEN